MKRKSKYPVTQTEAIEQELLFQWVDLHLGKYIEQAWQEVIDIQPDLEDVKRMGI